MKRYAFIRYENLWLNLGFDNPIDAYQSLNVKHEKDIYEVQNEYNLFQKERYDNVKIKDLNPLELSEIDQLFYDIGYVLFECGIG